MVGSKSMGTGFSTTNAILGAGMPVNGALGDFSEAFWRSKRSNWQLSFASARASRRHCRVVMAGVDAALLSKKNTYTFAVQRKKNPATCRGCLQPDRHWKPHMLDGGGCISASRLNLWLDTRRGVCLFPPRVAFSMLEAESNRTLATWQFLEM